MTQNLPVLHTERLILRPPTMGDFDRWAELMADPVASRYVGGVQAKSMAWRSLMAMAGAWSLTGVSMFSLIEKSSGRWVGRCGPWRPDGWPGTEVGWSLHPDAQGKGFATEAARACIDYAFDELGWTYVIHCIDPKNLASQKVAIRLGSSNRGPGKMPPPHDNALCDLWGQTRDQWRGRKTA